MVSGLRIVYLTENNKKLYNCFRIFRRFKTRDRIAFGKPKEKQKKGKRIFWTKIINRQKREIKRF